jgi:hypothetical protein
MSDLVRAVTPVFLGLLGGGIAIVAIISPSLPDQRFTASLGLAGSAIAGAAGLAQSSKNQ